MIETVRIFVEVAIVLAIMTTLAVIGAFAAAAITGDRTFVVAAGATAFVLTGAMCAVRLWRRASKPAAPNTQ